MMNIETVRIDLKKLRRAWALLDTAEGKLPHSSPLVMDPGTSIQNGPYTESLSQAIASAREARKLVNDCREILLRTCGHTAGEIDKV